MILLPTYRDRNPRLAILAGIITGGLVLLIVALFRVQVLNGERYDNRDEAQSLRRIRIPSARGEIVDRNGVVLANNRPSYDIAIYLDQLGRLSKTQDPVRIAEANLFSLRRLLNLPSPPAESAMRTHYQLRRPIPMPVWRDLKTDLVAAFSESAGDWPGTDLVVTPVRQYPHGSLAAHVLGYCGRAEQSDEEDLEHFFYYEPDLVGKQGVERSFDEYLRGEPGGRTIRVNPVGLKVGDVSEKEPERGNRVVLTIDARIQRIAENALQSVNLPAGKSLRGAVVALDPRDGEVLAMASYPAFDPNLSIAPYLQDPSNPLINRAIGGRYPPGSTFKPVTLLAGLEAGTIHMNDTATCPGWLQIGDRKFKCHKHDGHGTLSAMAAMAASCDVWFYQEGMKTGVDAISKCAAELGLGLPTGVDFGSERHGLVPTANWKYSQTGVRWWTGDTAQMSIGQSFLLVTPIQMANMAATLANGGTRWKPFVVKQIVEPHGAVVEQKQPEVAARLSARPGNIESVRQSMRAVIEGGTGRLAGVSGLSVAGKTGTAEFQTKTGRINRAWFIGFAPYERPTIALAVVIEDGESGSHTAAPVAQKILADIFQKSAEMVKGEIGVD
jgi:penicillin-binding protein 2